MSGQSQSSGKGGYGQPYQNYGMGYGQNGTQMPYGYGAYPAQQGSYLSAGGSSRPPVPGTGVPISLSSGSTGGSKGGSGYPSGYPTGAQIMGGGNPYNNAVPQLQTDYNNANPLGRTMDTGSLYGSALTSPYGNQPGQNDMVYTNGQFGFGGGQLAQLAPGTASMLGFQNNGRGQYVNAQGQVVGLV